MKKILSVLLAAVLVLGLVPAATAYTTPDFKDVPAGNWAYDAVMRMADAGVIEGVGGGKFDPNGSVTAEQFITLVGRAVFPDVKAEGKDWSGPYISEAKAKGMLDGTNVTDEAIKNAISRYDMAVILAKAVEILKLTATKADADKINDYGEVPTKYVDAVLTAYGSGLITGDDNRNFNGGNTMRRSEAATVMDRLLTQKEAAEKAEAEFKEAYKTNRTGEMVDLEVWGSEDVLVGAQVGLYYKDGRLLGTTVVDENGEWLIQCKVDKADYDLHSPLYYVNLMETIPSPYERQIILPPDIPRIEEIAGFCGYSFNGTRRGGFPVGYKYVRI